MEKIPQLEEVHRVIDPDNPFDSVDKLNREPHAKILTRLIENVDGGFVLAINSKWGTGKTTFVNMWKAQLKLDGYETILFNAWENDFDSNAQTAILGELKALTEDDKAQKILERVLENAATIFAKAVPAVVNVAVKYAFGVGMGKIVEAATKGYVDVLKKDAKAYKAKKDSVIAFKENLAEYVRLSCGEHPLIFIVDELDRCRPNYAVEVLEQIKHFFAVPGIVFVLSIDKEQLGYAIQGVYGSDKIDTNEYLRRFIDVEYSLPEPDTTKFCEFIIERMQFNKFFNSEDRLAGKAKEVFQQDLNILLEFSVLLFTVNKVPLRVQEKVLSHVRFVLIAFHTNSYVFPQLLVLLVYLRATKNDTYLKIKGQNLSLNELVDMVDELFMEQQYVDYDLDRIMRTQAQLLVQYSVYQNEIGMGKLQSIVKTANTATASLKSKLVSATDSRLESFVHGVINTQDTGTASLDHLLSRIDLVISDN